MSATAAGYRNHPLADGYPPAWADGWGEDRHGPFVELELGPGGPLRFRWVPEGEFLMGSPKDDEQAYGKEHPQHRVRLTEGFWLGETPVTQRQWRAVMPDNPSRFAGEGNEAHPVESVSWDRCAEFIELLNGRRQGLDLRLPTEAEWERACRAGDPAPRYGDLRKVGWFAENSDGSTKPVRQLLPNRLGLFDMLGNVFEWCADSQRGYGSDAVTNPVGTDPGGRVFRGGSWLSTAGGVRAAYRVQWHRDNRRALLGFRLARGPALQPLQPEPAERAEQD